MNITELARKLKMPTKQLKEMLPEMGFDIGARAIKVDDVVAGRIAKDWPRLKREYFAKKKAAEEEKSGVKKAVVEEKKDIALPSMITVRDFALKLNLPATQVIGELMKNGILASLNEQIDRETASIVAEDLGFVIIQEKDKDEDVVSEEQISKLLDKGDDKDLQPRSPVVVIMGHVDHGKTKLLDTIRKANVIDKEAGGITQHIGAYQMVVSPKSSQPSQETKRRVVLRQVETQDRIPSPADPRDKSTAKGRTLTFIDTPGHEAFTAMRSRGARIADIAILVVAADDGVKPQTKEAIKIIQSADLPMIVAINKIDKPEANVEKVKKELAEENLLPEDWGGKTITAPISAITGNGVDELLEMILLVADMHKDEIRANPNALAIGTIIEAHVDKGEGPVATMLVQKGTLKKNAVLSIENTLFGKVRAMKNYKGESLDQAEPSVPVKLIGFKVPPHVGDIVEVPADPSKLNRKMKAYDAMQAKLSSTITRVQEKDEDLDKLNLIIKTDVIGSLEAIILALEKLSHPDVPITIVGKGLGTVTEGDILHAEASNARVFAFHVSASQGASNLAREKGIAIEEYKVIYDLINEVKKAIQAQIPTELVTTIIGRVQVLEIFRTDKSSMVIGVKVTEGNITAGAQAQVLRKGEKITLGIVNELRSGKQAITTAETGQETGVKFVGEPILEKNDVLEIFTEQEQKKEA